MSADNPPIDLPKGYIKATGYSNRSRRRDSTLFASMPVTRFTCTRCRLPFIGKTQERCQCKAVVRRKQGNI